MIKRLVGSGTKSREDPLFLNPFSFPSCTTGTLYLYLLYSLNNISQQIISVESRFTYAMKASFVARFSKTLFFNFKGFIKFQAIKNPCYAGVSHLILKISNCLSLALS
ncbi:hypothetical protein BM527_16610 [Alteromonas sp. Mex14]|nr:hypothetical protein BM527_16610 [Alteromonas sp. Mex14]